VQTGGMTCFLLVGGWPRSGKTTVARALAAEMQLPYLSKDDTKEALMDALGAPTTVEESRRLGSAAVHALLSAARGCSGAVIDSTWFPYTRPLVDALPGRKIEIRCMADQTVCRERFRHRHPDARHLDDARSPDELWDQPVNPLGVGPVVEVDTEKALDVRGLAARIRVAS
jgi:predicted kinase